MGLLRRVVRGYFCDIHIRRRKLLRTKLLPLAGWSCPGVEQVCWGSSVQVLNRCVEGPLSRAWTGVLRGLCPGAEPPHTNSHSRFKSSDSFHLVGVSCLSFGKKCIKCLWGNFFSSFSNSFPSLRWVDCWPTKTSSPLWTASWRGSATCSNWCPRGLKISPRTTVKEVPPPPPRLPPCPRLPPRTYPGAARRRPPRARRPPARRRRAMRR